VHAQRNDRVGPSRERLRRHLSLLSRRSTSLCTTVRRHCSVRLEIRTARRQKAYRQLNCLSESRPAPLRHRCLGEASTASGVGQDPIAEGLIRCAQARIQYFAAVDASHEPVGVASGRNVRDVSLTHGPTSRSTRKVAGSQHLARGGPSTVDHGFASASECAASGLRSRQPLSP
jgi:hypothetical protein